MEEILLGKDHSRLSVSALAMGCMQLVSCASGSDSDRLLDMFRDVGGTFLDTAHCYCFWVNGGDGLSERLVGDYLRRRKCRESMVVATKGAHPSVAGYRQTEAYMSPCRLQSDLDDSLARLGIDVIDLYWLHRDDPRVPVCEILDMLEAEKQRGRIRFYGGSNWTAARLDEANRVAMAHGMTGFVASQPCWSLLDYENQSDASRLTPGALLHMNGDDRRRHGDSLLPVVCYGPTGKGFFANGGCAPASFQTRENQSRCRRVEALADELGVTPNQVALAWLKAQPFPVIPILGTSNAGHLQDALGCLSVSLSAEQVEWLEHGDS